MKTPILRPVVFLFLLSLVSGLSGCPAPTTIPPTADFTATPVSGTAPLVVQFADASTVGSSPITSYAWSFGDGGTSTEANPSHTYAAGTYTIRLTVTTADGSDEEVKTSLIQVQPDPSWAADTRTFDIEVADEVMVVEEEDLEDVILQYNQEEHAYLLDPDTLDSMGYTFDVGDPIILAGIEIGRITRAEEDETGLYIETEQVPLNEVFPDADIAWDYGVEFTPDIVKSIEIPGVGEYPIKAGTPISVTFEQGEFKYELTATLNVDSADFDFVVTKGIGAGVKGKFTAKGQISRFRNKNQISIADGTVQQFNHQLNGIKGTSTLDLTVAASGGDAIDFKIPVPIMKVPFVVGYIPAVLSIGAQFVVNAAVPLDGSARVGTTFTFDSDLGFNFNGTTVEAGGRAGNATFGDSTHQTGASSAISANFGVGYPRVSMSIAGGTLVGWAQTAFLVGGAYTFLPACQTADASFIGSAGYDLGIHGFELASGSKKLFEQKKELLRAGQCGKSEDYDAVVDILWGWEFAEPE
jgi:PKD repeat protein